MEYKQFLENKKKTFIESGFEAGKLNEHLFDFQEYTVRIALRKGRFALFEDCGLGKTLQQLVWAHEVSKHTNMPVLILAPLAIIQQTIEEGDRFGVKVVYTSFDKDNPHFAPVQIVNYEQLQNIDCSIFSGIVLDESSILKNSDGKTSQLLLSTFKKTPYKLCCTATPSPNDHMELGMHSEFLGGMSYQEMLAMFFVHDGGETSKWRLRKHATDPFWKYVCTWSISLDNPKTLGFNHVGYELPEIEYIEHLIPVENNTDSLFADVSVSATEIHKDLRRTIQERLLKSQKIVEENPGQFIIWGLQNQETDSVVNLVNDAINVQGSDKPERKAKYLNGFAKSEFNTLVTKTKIASMGMNYQQCNQMIFLSYDFKFEQFYQAVRRCYRFGQKRKVTVHLLVPESQQNVRQSILEKEARHKEMISQMAKYSAEADYTTNKSKVVIKENEIHTENYSLYCGDAVEESKKIADNSAGITIYSPPFPELYVYSDNPKDMNNCANYNQFSEHYNYLLPEIKRITKPGRMVAVHCMDLPVQKGKHGYIGLRDFSGDIIKWHQEHGMVYHSRVTIWKNPVTEMQRTKALGLLHKTIKKDSVMSRVGIPDYVLFFRNEGENEIPITHQDKDETGLDYLPVDLWQKYASPVWYDIDYGRTLQYRAARDNNDEKHITPLQLDTIERVLHLYSNEGETVFSPFGGIGSEGCAGIKLNRKSISIELKESYFKINAANHKAFVEEKNATLTLF